MPEHIDRFSRPLTYHPQTLPSLPSIDDLTLSLRRCSTCSKLLGDTESCTEHERPSSFGLQLAEYQLPRDPFNKNAPIPCQTQNHPSPVMSSGDASSDSDPMYTPNVSRATSPITLGNTATSTTTQHRRRPCKKTSRRDSRRESLQVDSISEQSKKIKKMEKEKACRSQQANCLSRSEDFFGVYCNWERREQSGGNGNGAGLYANKINILRAQEVIAQDCLHEKRCEALRGGPEAVAAFQKWFQNKLTSAPDETPFAHTFLSGAEDPCTHRDPKSKECTTHGTADWRDCRALQSRARFQEQQARWIQANLSWEQQEALRRANVWGSKRNLGTESGFLVDDRH